MTHAPVRLLLVSHSYVLANTRGKVRALARHCRLTLLTPSRWPFDFIEARAETEHDPSFEMVSSRVLLAGRNIRYIYSPLAAWRVLRRVRPGIVIIEEEPASLVLTQFSLMKQRFGYRLLFFTWENISWQPFATGWIERFNLRAADGAIAGSQSARTVLQRKGFRQPIAVIPQIGIDPALFQPRDTPLPPTPFVITYAGRIVEEKGLRTLFQAITELPGEWEIHMIGSGPLRTELDAMAERAGWVHRLRWHGIVGRDSLPRYYQASHVFVLPSCTMPRWKEQFGRVLVEAMACGVPVVGSNSGAIPEVIGDAGMVVPEDDAEALSRALKQLMTDSTLRQTLSARAAERARTRYSDRTIADTLCQFIDEFV